MTQYNSIKLSNAKEVHLIQYNDMLYYTIQLHLTVGQTWPVRPSIGKLKQCLNVEQSIRIFLINTMPLPSWALLWGMTFSQQSVVRLVEVPPSSLHCLKTFVFRQGLHAKSTYK